jgi:hypothetical protein
LLPDDGPRFVVDFFLWEALPHRFFRKVRELLKMDWLRPEEQRLVNTKGVLPEESTDGTTVVIP